MSEETAEAFLAVSHQFRLGDLPTESVNPKTVNLSQLCSNRETLPDALRALQQVDVDALRTLVPLVPQIEALAGAISQTFRKGRRVFCEGCGATGRLSLSLETFVREGMLEDTYAQSVFSFMAGGDAALIRSIENFEDSIEYGVRQLHSMGFVDGDLLIAITEGGETTFVISACEEASRLSPSNPPFFVYCNPDHILSQVAARSRRVIENASIRKLCIPCGPMAITGSTRMQATTVQLTAVGVAMVHHDDSHLIGVRIRALLDLIATLDYGTLADVTAGEAGMYARREYFLVDAGYFTMTVMTDTTERSPTFSFPPFENFDRPNDPPSPLYVVLPTAKDAQEGWHALLRRPPRGLEWPETKAKTGAAVIAGYDFSRNVVQKREATLGPMRVVKVEKGVDGISIFIPHLEVRAVVPVPQEILRDRLMINIVAKCVLNAHSTAIMGILGRYEGNVMTFVKATNNKLVDRAARYAIAILKQRGITASYADVCTRLFRLQAVIAPDEPIVMRIVKDFEST